MQKSFPFLVSGTRATHTCLHGLSVHTHMRVCVHTLRVSSSLYFLKKFYYSKNKLIVSINISLSQFSLDWALNQPWTFEYYYQWGRRARVVRGTKWGIYKCPSFDLWALLTESKEKEKKHFVSMYNMDPTCAYMGPNATPQSCMGFICPKSHGCYSGNK